MHCEHRHNRVAVVALSIAAAVAVGVGVGVAAVGVRPAMRWQRANNCNFWCNKQYEKSGTSFDNNRGNGMADSQWLRNSLTNSVHTKHTVRKFNRPY